MTTPDPRIVLRGREAGEEGDPIVDHPEQPGDYFHADGTVWNREKAGGVGGVHLRVYDLMPRIAMRVLTAAGYQRNPVVDHLGQPADYIHTDGTVGTWRNRWRPLGGGRYLRVYDLVD